MATSVKLPADDVGARKQRRDGIRGGRYGEIFLIGARIAAALPWPSQAIDTDACRATVRRAFGDRVANDLRVLPIRSSTMPRLSWSAPRR